MISQLSAVFQVLNGNSFEWHEGLLDIWMCLEETESILKRYWKLISDIKKDSNDVIIHY